MVMAEVGDAINAQSILVDITLVLQLFHTGLNTGCHPKEDSNEK